MALYDKEIHFLENHPSDLSFPVMTRSDGVCWGCMCAFFRGNSHVSMQSSNLSVKHDDLTNTISDTKREYALSVALKILCNSSSEAKFMKLLRAQSSELAKSIVSGIVWSASRLSTEDKEFRNGRRSVDQLIEVRMKILLLSR